MEKLKELESFGIDIGTEIGKKLYCSKSFILEVFYGVSNLDSLKKGFDKYEFSKFLIAIEDFQEIEERKNKEAMKAFYADLPYNKQNLSYLYTLFDTSRKSTFRLHMKVLAFLSGRLKEKGTLTFYESRLLSNISTLNENDFLTFYKVVKNRDQERFKDGTYMYRTNELNEILSLQKLSDIGMIYQKHSDFLANEKQKRFQFLLTDYTLELYNMLDLFYLDNE